MGPDKSHLVDSASLSSPTARGLPILADMRRLYQFVVLVESTSQTEAAKQLFVTQQGLSSSIRQLERDLGVTLFDRTHRSWTLTEAGKSLYADGRPLIARNEALVRRVHSAVAGTRAVRFLIGHSSLIPNARIARIAHPAIARFPGYAINAAQLSTSDLIDQLLDGTVDLGLTLGYLTDHDIDSATVSSTGIRVAVTEHSPLAEHSTITLRDLANTPIVVHEDVTSSPLTRLFVAHCRCAGFDPDIVVNPLDGMPTTTGLTFVDDGCALITQDEPHSPELRVLTVADLPEVPIQAVWLAGTASEPRAAILAAAGDFEALIARRSG